VGCAPKGLPTDLQRSAAEAAESIGDLVGVALQDLHAFHLDAERIGDDLREDREVALPGRG